MVLSCFFPVFRVLFVGGFVGLFAWDLEVEASEGRGSDRGFIVILFKIFIIVTFL